MHVARWRCRQTLGQAWTIADVWEEELPQLTEEEVESQQVRGPLCKCCGSVAILVDVPTVRYLPLYPVSHEAGLA